MAKQRRPSPKEIVKPSIGLEVLTFVRNLDGLEASFSLVMEAANKASEKADKDYSDFLSIHGKLVEKKGGVSTFNLDVRYQHKADNLRREFTTWGSAIYLLPQSLLVSLVSEYDGFLGRLLGCLFHIQPGLLNLGDQIIPFPQLLELGSIEKAKDFLIEKQVESLLRSSHSEQFSWLEKEFKLPLRDGLSSWPDFVELTERRNLFVHCNGIVSSQYLGVCKLHKISQPDGLRHGKRLDVSPEYFRKAHRCIFEIGVKLAHVLWRKVTPDDRKASDLNLLEIAYETLVAERYDIAIVLLDFAAVTLKSHANDELRRLFILNRAIAYKWNGDDAKSKAIVMEHDWSSSQHKFQLAVAVLLDDYREAVHLMKEIGPKGDPNSQAYKDWPLFKKFRTTPQFLQAYRQVFGKPFTTESIRKQSKGP